MELETLDKGRRIVEIASDKLAGLLGKRLAFLPLSAAGLEHPGLDRLPRQNLVIEFDPPPTQAITRSGKRPNCSRHWARVSRPITDWKSRTIRGNGCGPITEPRQ